MKRSGCLRRFPAAVAPFLVALISCFSCASVHADPITCYNCHGSVSPPDYRPVDAASRDIVTGGFPGNHRTHMGESATPVSCSKCHPSGEYKTDHMFRSTAAIAGNADSLPFVRMTGNINNSLHPDKGKYAKARFFHQTSSQPLSTCSNVNCHFEATTPPWGAPPSLTTCGSCHGAPPSDGSHPKHGAYYGGAGSCKKCHGENVGFQHATSVGKRPLRVDFSLAPGSGNGSYSGDLSYPAYLPSQSRGRSGTCSAIYCHSNGAPHDSAIRYSTPAWGGSMPGDCTGCHGGNAASSAPIASGKHGKHTGPTAGYRCGECHGATVGSGDDCSITGAASHVDGVKTVTFSGGGSYAHETRGCSATQCHRAGKTGAPQPSPLWTDSGSGCNVCHGSGNTIGAPDYPSAGAGAPLANSHGAHARAAVDCGKCHAQTTTSGTSIKAGSSTHIDQTINVDFNTAEAGTDAGWAAGSKTCSNITCHPASYQTAAWGAKACLSCHAVAIGNRAAITAQFGGNSHHIQGDVTDEKCYQCHWEANGNGTINPAHHGGSKLPGSKVDLVVYGAGSRPASYSEGATAVQYTANGTREEIAKVTNHCLGCHSDQNNNIQPFSDGNTPNQYAWDGTSVAARYAQTNTTTWGKYSTANGANKRIAKAYSAHGKAGENKRGWDTVNGVDGAIPNTSGSANVQCYDCHNSHGSFVPGITSRYSSATGKQRGAILKSTVAGQGGYAVAYQPYTGGSVGDKNRRNPGASLCLDCHLSRTTDATPWGYNSTFGASQAVLGYWDAPSYKGYTTAGAAHIFSFKGMQSIKGGHFGASRHLSGRVKESIDGLCTPCHDPHGVSPTLGSNQQFAVPLLKGTWVTSAYKEDVPPVNDGRFTNRRELGGEGIHYNIDQNTFASDLNGQQLNLPLNDVGTSAGLCLRCHPKNSLTDGQTHDWKDKNRIHESVQGWRSAPGDAKHSYTCSKCHSPHTNSVLPRLMVTNCLDSKHKGRKAYNPTAKISDSGYGHYVANSDLSKRFCSEIPYSFHRDGYAPRGGAYGWCGLASYIRGTGSGGGGLPGGWRGDIWNGEGHSLRCHEENSTDQSWNEVTPWAVYPAVSTTPDVVADRPAGSWFNTTGITFTNKGGFGPSGIMYYRYAWDQSNTGHVFTGTEATWTNGTLTLAASTAGNWYLHVQTYDINGTARGSQKLGPYLFDGTPPAQLASLAPTDGSTSLATNTMLSATVASDDNSGSVQYYFEIATDSRFFTGEILCSGWQSGTTFVPALALGTTYYWHVKARDAARNETPYTATHSFRTAAGTIVWTTRGDFENNLTTGVSMPTIQSRIDISGADQASDAFVRLKLSSTSTISSHGSHTLAIKTDGTVWGWGFNGYGQLGNGTKVSSPIPVRVAGEELSSGVVAVAAGYGHSLALKSDGTVWAWGDNWYGELGNNSTVGSLSPVQVRHAGGPLTEVIAIAAGDYHSLALKSDGTVWAWGFNDRGQVGNNSVVNSLTAVQVMKQGGGTFSGAVAVAAGQYHSLALKSDGTVWAWGTNGTGQLGNNSSANSSTAVQVLELGGGMLSGVTAIEAGGFFSVALKKEGTLWAWGDNSSGQLGQNDRSSRGSAVQVLQQVTAVAAGSIFCMALRFDGSLWGWGSNLSGQLGSSSITDRLVPAPIAGLDATAGITGILAGSAHSLAVKADRSVLAWGDNSQCQLGDGTTVIRTSPTKVSGLGGSQPAVVVAAGSNFSIFARPEGATASGSNIYGQLGDNSTTVRTGPVEMVQQPEGPLGDVIALSAGQWHSLALKRDGTLWTWGSNIYGQLGDGTTVPKNSPVQITYFNFASGITAAAAGGMHSLAVRSDGTVWSWGGNGFGQLGEGTTSTGRSTPWVVQQQAGIALNGASKVAAGYGHSLASKSDGTVWAWGNNNLGQLGNNSSTNSSWPVQVMKQPGVPLSGITAVAAGHYHSVALKNDGTVWAWGYNYYGQLGNKSSVTNSLLPVQVLEETGVALSGIIAVAAGQYHSLALRNDGTVWTWGHNYYGQLGDTTTTQRNAAVKVAGISSGATAIAAGSSHSLALMNDGTVSAWGNNNDGQLGTGSSRYNVSPAQNLMPDVQPPLRFGSPGTISSLRFDAGSTVDWGRISWNGMTPPDTALRFRTRGAAADTEAEWGAAAWSDYYPLPGAFITTPQSRWLEIELTEESANNVFSPTLEDFTISLQ